MLRLRISALNRTSKEYSTVVCHLFASVFCVVIGFACTKVSLRYFPWLSSRNYSFRFYVLLEWSFKIHDVRLGSKCIYFHVDFNPYRLFLQKIILSPMNYFGFLHKLSWSVLCVYFWTSILLCLIYILIANIVLP